MKIHPRSSRPAPFLGLLLLAVAAAPSHAAAKYKIKWLIGHPNLDYFEESAADFKTAVEKRSRGEISVEIVEAKNLWEDSAEGRPGPEIAASVAKGEAQMGHSFTDVMGGMDHRLWAFDLPYLFRDYRHLEGVFEGPVGREMLDGLASNGIKGLAFTYSGGANGVATTSKEIRGPEDFAGLKVGMFGAEADRAWVKGLGATPVAVRHREDGVLPVVAAGGADAMITTWRRFERSEMHRRFKYFNMAGSSYLVSVTYINQKFFDGLPPKYQKLLTDTVRETARIERFKTIELNEQAKREMVARGVIPVALTAGARARFAAALKPVYAKELEGLVGRSLIERLRAVPPGAAHPGVDLAAR